jgi:hypothetical protein
MYGIIFGILGTFFREVAASIGKNEITKHEESIYTMAVLDFLGAVVVFLILVLSGQSAFSFSIASLPTYGVRVILEIAQMTATMNGIARSDRSTMGFIMVGTIPLLLVVDAVLGYSLEINQIIGVALIMAAFLFLFSGQQFSKKGLGFVIFSTINAAATLSLYKYNITHFNSVAGEQLPMYIILLTYFFLIAHFVTKEQPLKLLSRRIFMAQTLAEGMAAFFASFAYAFGPTSVITAVKRASSIFWSTLSGNVYFHEHHILLKLFMFLMLASGIVLIAV